jgi:hypothetical protein
LYDLSSLFYEDDPDRRLFLIREESKTPPFILKLFTAPDDNPVKLTLYLMKLEPFVEPKLFSFKRPIL